MLIPAAELDLSASNWPLGNVINDPKEEFKSDHQLLSTEPIESKSGLMSQISIKQFEQRRIIEDYMHQMEEQERQVNKDYLLRVIKSQANNINKYDEDWDAPVVV